jgi:predicted transcriptional regulator
MPKSPAALSRREREIMDILHRRGRATAWEVMAELSGEPAYSTVRAQLRVLEQKGHLRHTEEQLRYVYSPAASRHRARRSALTHLLDTFFNGSAADVVEALLGHERRPLTRDQLDRIAELIDRAKRQDRS